MCDFPAVIIQTIRDDTGDAFGPISLCGRQDTPPAILGPDLSGGAVPLWTADPCDHFGFCLCLCGVRVRDLIKPDKGFQAGRPEQLPGSPERVGVFREQGRKLAIRVLRVRHFQDLPRRPTRAASDLLAGQSQFFGGSPLRHVFAGLSRALNLKRPFSMPSRP